MGQKERRNRNKEENIQRIKEQRKERKEPRRRVRGEKKEKDREGEKRTGRGWREGKEFGRKEDSEMTLVSWDTRKENRYKKRFFSLKKRSKPCSHPLLLFPLPCTTLQPHFCLRHFPGKLRSPWATCLFLFFSFFLQSIFLEAFTLLLNEL